MRYHLTINLHGDTPTTLGIEANNIAHQVRALKLALAKSSLFHGRNHSFEASKVSQNNDLIVGIMTDLSEIESEFNKIYETCAELATRK